MNANGTRGPGAVPPDECNEPPAAPFVRQLASATWGLLRCTGMVTRRRRWQLAGMLLLLATALVGCERIAEVIPGSEDARLLARRTPTPTSTPIISPAGSASGGVQGPTIADAQLAPAIVQIQAVDASTGLNQTFRIGSGVVVDAPNRLILTSYGVVQPFKADGTAAYNTIVIATNRANSSPPAPEFEAELVAADPGMDIAVLRVVRDLGRPSLSPGTFDLPAAVLGDARAASAGLPLRLFGFPGSSESDGLSVTNATITGVRGAAGVSGRTWLKTDARLPFGTAGGAALNQAGALVGILAQERYLPTGEVGQIRPLDLALDSIERARKAPPGARFDAPLVLSGNIPGTARPLPGDQMWISRPAFGENAIESQGNRDIFDYNTVFAAGKPALYYEYVLEGVPAGTVIEERWYLDDLLQDSLSSSYRWDGRGFGMAGDRITVPGAGGIPRGRWRLEIWAGDALRAQATALIGVELREPKVGNFADGSAAAPDATPLIGSITGEEQLLVFFDFDGFESVQRIDWLVFHENQRVYTSPAVRWVYGDSGRFWVGYAPGKSLGPGKWELELHVDGRVFGLRVITLPPAHASPGG